MRLRESAGAVERLRLLVFTAGGLRFAADADQVASLQEFVPAANEVRAFWFHEAIGGGVPREAVRHPQLCLVRRDAELCRFIIDAPEDLIELDAHSISPLPPLAEPFALERGIWAALPYEHDEIILLVDFIRLATRHDLWSAQGDTP
ncbi:hypothetical protein EG829_01170 [bacterium]|nr:hypothetical protein [bacterium]